MRLPALEVTQHLTTARVRDGRASVLPRLSRAASPGPLFPVGPGALFVHGRPVTYEPAMTLLTDRAARAGLFLLVILWGALLAVEARASEVPPPLIADMRRVVVDVRRALEGRSVPKDAARGDGAMCGPALVEDAADDIPERETVERMLAKCSRASRRSDPWAVLSLLRLERDMGAPPGLLSAAACWETGYQSGGHGDWLDGVARAKGMLQMHGWWVRYCGWSRDMRDDVEASARCYLRRVLHYLGDGVCPGNVTRAEAMAANGVRYAAWKCAAVSEHGRELARWSK